MVGGRSRTQRRSVRKSAAAAIGAWENINPLYVQTRSKEAGCLAREGPLRRGRGEAAGDCADAVEPSRQAAEDRTVGREYPHRTRQTAAAGETRTGSSGYNEQEAEILECYSEEKGKNSSRGKVHRPTAGAEARRSFCKAVGLGTCGSLSGTRDRKAGIPPCRRDSPI